MTRYEIVSALSILAEGAHNRCKEEGWERDWKEGGCYLHLEVSEFIEALRGKRGVMEEEVAHILFVCLSIAKENNLNMKRVVSHLTDKSIFHPPTRGRLYFSEGRCDACGKSYMRKDIKCTNCGTDRE
jgi:NTP pyrophosphatase (non-canonical NTP hydrolase)